MSEIISNVTLHWKTNNSNKQPLIPKGNGHVLGIQLVTGDDPGWFGILRTPQVTVVLFRLPLSKFSMEMQVN